MYFPVTLHDKIEVFVYKIPRFGSVRYFSKKLSMMFFKMMTAAILPLTKEG